MFYSKEDEFPSGLNRQAQGAYCYPQVTTASSYNRCVSNDTVLSRQRNQQKNYRHHQQPKKTTDPKPKIRKLGEYKCGACGRFWTSRYCWPDKYQNCKRCKRPVYAHIYRELKASDYVKDDDDKHPHEKELCQMCQQLGHSCATKISSKRYEKKKIY